MAVAAGVSLFLFLLGGATDFFQLHWKVAILFLPLWGLALYWLQRLSIFRQLATSETIIEEIKNPRQKVSSLLAPFIIATTVLSHFFGACVGRESAAIQIGASVAEAISEVFKKIFQLPENRSLILRLGLAAGFSAAFGTPWTALVFALEHPQHFTRSAFKSLFWVGLVAWGAYFFSSLWGPSHTHWPQIYFSWSTLSIQQWLILSICLAALCFVYEALLHSIQSQAAKFKMGAPLFAAGCIILAATYSIGSPAYNGLGTNLTAMALNQELIADSSWQQFGAKLFFLLLSVGSGFKGGEVTPLISVAALFANASTGSVVFVAASLSALFSFRLRAPIAGIVILAELLNWNVALLGFGPIFATWLLNELAIKFFAQRVISQELKIISTYRRYF